MALDCASGDGARVVETGLGRLQRAARPPTPPGLVDATAAVGLDRFPTHRIVDRWSPVRTRSNPASDVEADRAVASTQPVQKLEEAAAV